MCTRERKVPKIYRCCSVVGGAWHVINMRTTGRSRVYILCIYVRIYAHDILQAGRHAARHPR